MKAWVQSQASSRGFCSRVVLGHVLLELLWFLLISIIPMAGLSLSRGVGFDAGPIIVGFVMDKVPVGQVFLQVLFFFACW
jgi:hypothetical protein